MGGYLQRAQRRVRRRLINIFIYYIATSNSDSIALNKHAAVLQALAGNSRGYRYIVLLRVDSKRIVPRTYVTWTLLHRILQLPLLQVCRRRVRPGTRRGCLPDHVHGGRPQRHQRGRWLVRGRSACNLHHRSHSGTTLTSFFPARGKFHYCPWRPTAHIPFKIRPLVMECYLLPMVL